MKWIIATLLALLVSPAFAQTRVQLNWNPSTDNVGVTGYNIFRNGAKVGTSATTSFVDTGLTPSTNYTYTVKAFDAAGNESAASTQVVVTTLAATTGGWPNESNTGIPPGTTLKPYTGSCTITTTQTIDGFDVAAKCDAVIIKAANVVIKNSNLPLIEQTEWSQPWSVTVQDSRVSSPTWSEGVLWGFNITAIRVNVTGGQHSFHCNNNCSVTDSWLHGQYNPADKSYHNNAFITNGGTNMTLRHNTLHCDAILGPNGGGCSGDASLFGDFEAVSHVTLDNNLLKANNSSISYCFYGGNEPAKPYPVSTYIVFTNNVFERGANRKCGVFGPVTSFQSSATGNVWTNNTWADDGSQVTP